MVGVGIVPDLVEIFREPCIRGTDILPCLIVESHELDGIAHFGKPCRSLKTEICPEAHSCLALLAGKFLCSHKEDAVGSPRSVYCRRRSILQHRHAFYIFRIERRNVTFHTVHKNQRIGISDSTYASHPDRSVGDSGLSGRIDHCHARQHSLES